MSPSRGSGSWNYEYARPDGHPRYGQAPNPGYNDYQFSSREYQSYSGSANDAFYSGGPNPRFAPYAYPVHYAEPSRMPERRRSPDYAEYRREGYSSHNGPYEGGRFENGWAESERGSHLSSRSLDYSRPPMHRDYDFMPPGSRGYHSNTRDYDRHILPRDPSVERDTRRSGYGDYSHQWPGPENGRSREDYRDAVEQTDDRNRSYSSYRRPSLGEDSSERPTYSSYQSRPSPPPPNRNQATTNERRQSAPRFHPLPSKPSPGPPPPTPLPRRTNPTKEYIEISHQPPSHLPDTAISRKLIVLDLNGSLVVRGAHTKVPPTRKGGGGRPFDPYANPTQPRPLRPVHPRPYLKSFTAYLLHNETKKWLDTMVWSSAQPHSVNDMVGKTFLERKVELIAVWARDTLGLTAEEYHSKSLTMKDLAKPWAELPTLKASYLTKDKLSSSNCRSTSKSPSPRPTTKPIDRIDSTDPLPQRHSALSSLLVDDSPLKAALQPWNHLCIREYVQDMRRHDLVVAECDAARERVRKAAEDREAFERRLAEEGRVKEKGREDTQMEDGGAATEPEDAGETGKTGQSSNDSIRRVIREVVMVDGEMVGTAEVVRQVSREVVMIEGQMINPEEDPIAPTPLVSSKHRNRRLKRLAKKFEMKQIREEKEKEIFELLKKETEARGSRPAMVEGEDKISPTDANALAVVREQMEMRYDETLLAVIGVLDQIKNESNVAGWMRSGGLLHATHPPIQLPANGPTRPPRAEKHPAPSRSESPVEEGSPTKKRRMHNKRDDSVAEVEIQPPPTSFPVSSIIPASSQPCETDVTSSAEDGTAREKDKKEQASTGVPLSPPPPPPPPDSPLDVAAADVGPKDLWYQDPAVLNYWVDRGRQALEKLGIEVESGIEPVPGGLASNGKP